MQKSGLCFMLLIVLAAAGAFAQSPCAACHGDSSMTRPNVTGGEDSLYVNEALFAQSVHGRLNCSDCHRDAVGDPHDTPLKRVDCARCHGDAAAEYAKGLHGRALAAGDQDAPVCSDCHGKHDILSSLETASRTHPAHLPSTCGACHRDKGLAEKHDIRIAAPVEKFSRGVHGKALMNGNDGAATCSSCHEVHNLRAASDPKSPVNRANISKTCGTCHGDVQAEFDTSIHGKDLAKGIADVPTCTYCHGEHEILSPNDNNSPTAASNVSEKICASCHGMLQLNEKYGINLDPVTSYRGSYHGLATHRGSKVAANCTSCHGVHAILPQSDPASTIHVANLSKTCGYCHPNASQEFSRSYIHARPNSFGDALAAYIGKAYIWLIVVVIGGMVLHNLIIWFKYARAKWRALKLQKTIQRFDRQWIIQHVAILISFTLLVITGFALKYPNTTWARLLTTLGLNEWLRGTIHRIAAAVMLAAGLYHLGYLAFARSARGELQALLPGINDVRQFIANMKFHLGMSKERANFGRYGYVEKAEYWALVWGTLVMALTGFILWFPTTATYLLPAWIVKVAETIHLYEAWLAFLAILLYHMFFAIFHPADYPINLTGFTGKITEEEAEERFPAWFEEVKKKEEAKDSGAE
ncbi:MAG TPA: cytochrome c3 family protein [bacterium]|nr:cytochrome c3 family protein [bacterium]HQJ63629.1 cytochrome c3 family protein [bacterium]